MEAFAKATGKPFWSVMIPTYQPKEHHLRQSLESVLQQDPGPEQMQIHVVDDFSPDVDVADLVRRLGGSRVEFSRTPKNLGIAGCWNACIELARGEWVHLLHQDDYVLPDFYQKLADAAAHHPDVALLATRCSFVTEQGKIWKTSERLPELENGGRVIEKFFYGTPIQCPGITVQKSFYAKSGGFHPGLNFVLDCEMWARVIGTAGGLVIPDVLACYRSSDGATTSRLERTAENLRDVERLNAMFAARYPEFDRQRALRRVCYRAKDQADFFIKKGDAEAARANLEFWHTHSTPSIRVRRFLGNCLRSLR